MSKHENVIELPSGYSMRAARIEDLEPSLEMLNICARAQTGREELTLTELRNEWTAPGADLHAQCRVVVDAQDRIVGYIEVWDNYNPPVDMWVWGRVHPDHEGRGLGTALMAWAQRLAAQAIDRCPPDTRVIMRAGALSTHEPTKALFDDLGMELVRHFWRMQITFDGASLPKPVWPEGIVVRPYRHPQDLEGTMRADMDAFRDHWGFIERSEDEEVVTWRHRIESDSAFDPDLWFLAMDGEEIAGICLCSPTDSRAPGCGYVTILGVRRPWRRRGLGTALLHHCFAEFFRRGKLGVTLGVDADSITGATRLYERVGMAVIEQRDVYELELRAGVELGNTG